MDYGTCLGSYKAGSAVVVLVSINLASYAASPESYDILITVQATDTESATSPVSARQ